MNPTDSVLEMDDAVMCEDPSHRVMQWLSGVVIVVIAAGLPLLLMLHLMAKTKNYNDTFQGKNKAVATRMAVELGVPVEAAEFVIRDVTIGRDLAFVMDAYEPRYLYLLRP
jgi:hypothetical protein